MSLFELGGDVAHELCFIELPHRLHIYIYI